MTTTRGEVISMEWTFASSSKSSEGTCESIPKWCRRCRRIEDLPRVFCGSFSFRQQPATQQRANNDQSCHCCCRCRHLRLHQC